MIPLDAQQQRLLERLRKAGDQPVAFGELHAGGIDFPAAVVSELELNGYVIKRVYHHGWAGRRTPAPSRPSRHDRHIRRQAARQAAPATPIASRRAPRDQRRQPKL